MTVAVPSAPGTIAVLVDIDSPCDNAPPHEDQRALATLVERLGEPSDAGRLVRVRDIIAT
jgi:hypothetical protein